MVFRFSDLVTVDDWVYQKIGILRSEFRVLTTDYRRRLKKMMKEVLLLNGVEQEMWKSMEEGSEISCLFDYRSVFLKQKN